MVYKRTMLAVCFALSVGQVTQGSQAEVSLLPAVPAHLNQVAENATGQAKIKQGIEQAIEIESAAWHSAQTLNLKDELNIPAIVSTFGCKTSMGAWYMEALLAKPLTAADHVILANRRAIIEFLVNNPEEKQSLEELLNALPEYEQDIMQLMSDYFKGRTCPELLGLAVIKQSAPFMYPMSEFLELNPVGRFMKPGIAALGMTGCGAFSCYSASCGDIGSATFFGLLGGLDGYTLYTDYSTASEKRIKMHALNRLIDIAEQCEVLCKKHNMPSQFKMSAIKDTVALEVIKKLKHARYKEKDTIAFITPLVHLLLFKVYENQQALTQVFASIAELDAYNAIATKIIEAKNKNNKFCFATFIESEQPCVRSKGFWNVLVKDPIVNSVDEDKNVILTGPNAGGKTTTIRSILQNILFVQTFGIAAAESFECTMFDMIESYLHVSDDLIKGDSLFKAEVKRAQSILEKIKTLEPGKKYFFALDELFTGTVSEDGEECAYQFVNRISEFKGIQFIYATHFKRLKEVGSNNARCANHKVGAPKRNEAGVLVYPFTFTQGANDTNIAIEIAKDAGLFA